MSAARIAEKSILLLSPAGKEDAAHSVFKSVRCFWPSAPRRGLCTGPAQPVGVHHSHSATNIIITAVIPLDTLRWGTEGDKRLRIYFRYDHKLLGKLCLASWETIRGVYVKEVDGDVGTPAMVCAVQTFGDLVNYHPHIHSVAPEGVFTKSGYFVHNVSRLQAGDMAGEGV